MLHIRKVKPLFTSVIITGDRFEDDWIENGLIVAKKGDIKVWQKVLFVGDSVRNLQPGDMVMVNFENYAKRRYDKNSIQNDLDNNPIKSYDIHWLTIDDDEGNPMECIKINDRDVEYAFEGEERPEPQIVAPQSQLIV